MCAMKIDSLEAHNIDPDVLDVWRRALGEHLLPVQELAVKEFGLLTGGNLIVFSPTSSGKTFIGEMAAVQAARHDKKVFYLVPQKALAEEKYQEFRQRYEPLGIKVAISTRDHREYDADLERADFQIAVVVFEKMQGLLVSKPALVDLTGLVVVDELQLITDETRGPNLELLLTKIASSQSRPRLLGLSAVLGRAEVLAAWLGARLLVDNRRPVELRKGVLCRGRFAYREHNTGQAGSEAMVDIGSDDKKEVLLATVEDLVGRGEQVLMFLSTRPESVGWARLLAGRLTLPAVEEAVEEVRELEETEARRVLWEVLSSGVAFHNSDLRPHERELVERHFRSGAVRVLCSTSTLAMGMNMPAKNVILDEGKWARSKTYRRHVRQPITKSEYENMSGRAGRYSLEPDFGRSMLVTTSPFQARAWMETFVDAPFEEIAPTLLERPLEDHVLNLVASGLCGSQEEIEAFLRGSFTGYVHWEQKLSREEFRAELARAIAACLEGELVRRSGERLETTDIGRACATHGLAAATGVALAGWVRRGAASEVVPLEVLAVASLTADGRDIYIYLRKGEVYEADYRERLLTAAAKAGCAERRVFQRFRDSPCNFDLDTGRAQKKTLFLHDLIEEVPLGEIEQRYAVWAGAVRNVAEAYAWLVEGMASIAQAVGWPRGRQAALSRLATRLAVGLRDDAVGLAALKVKGLGRGSLRRLVDAGLGDVDALAHASQEELRQVLNHRGRARRLYEHLARLRQDAAAAVEETAPEVPPEAASLAAEGQAVYLPAGEQPASPTIHFVGACRKRRYLLRINGREAWLTLGAFQLLWRLAARRHTSEMGWAHTSDLHSGDNAHQALSRLRAALVKHAGEPARAWLENDGHGSYRLALPARDLTWDEEHMQAYHPDLLEFVIPSRQGMVGQQGLGG